MAKVTITGGAGFIGSNLAYRLLHEGHDVTLFDNLSRSGGASNVQWLRELPASAHLRLVQADLTDFEALQRAIEGAARVYHLAGQVAVTTSVTKPRADFEANALGTFNALEAARLVGDDPIFLYASTNKVYGGMEEVRIVEEPTRYAYADFPRGIPESTPLDFHSPYGCCYAADAEVLTHAGWKRFPELGAQDELLTYNMARRCAEFQRPTAHFAYPHHGPMYVQRHPRLHSCVTPNHKMLVAASGHRMGLDEPTLREAQSIAGQPMAYLVAAELAGGSEIESVWLPAVAANDGGQPLPERAIPMDDWLRFLGWYLAAGHYEEVPPPSGSDKIRLASCAAEASAALRALGLCPHAEGAQVVANAQGLGALVKPFGSPADRFIPRALFGLAQRQRTLLLDALLAGGGSPHEHEGWRYTTPSKPLADDLQELAIRCGWAATLVEERAGQFALHLCQERSIQCNADGDQSGWVPYEGMVYCVEVPNSVILVRQAGRPYFSGNSKGAGDQYTRDYQRIYGLRSVVMRQSCIYGYRQFGIEDQGWVAWFIIAALKGRPISIFGDGKQVRDVLFIDDLLDGYEAAVQQIAQAAGQIYNLGGGPDNTMAIWREFGPMLERLLGHPIPVRHAEWRPGDQPVYVSNIDKIRRELGWQPRVGVEEGLARLFAWIRDHQALFAHL